MNKRKEISLFVIECMKSLLYVIHVKIKLFFYEINDVFVEDIKK